MPVVIERQVNGPRVMEVRRGAAERVQPGIREARLARALLRLLSAPSVTDCGGVSVRHRTWVNAP